MADMNVYLYPNTSNEDGLADEAYSALETALEETTSLWPSLDTYSLDIDYSYPDLNDPDKDTFKSNFEQWTWLNASGDGIHLAISSNWGGGVADSGEGTENAFVNEAEGVIGSPSENESFFKTTAVHEAYHPYIDSSLNDVQKILGPNNDEHSLGEVPSDNKVTPMVAGYVGDDLDSVGDCDDSYSPDGHTASPSYCTSKAVYQTYQDRG